MSSPGRFGNCLHGQPPELNGAVENAGGKSLTVRAKSHCGNDTFTLEENSAFVGCTEFPEAKGAVPAPGGEHRPGGMQGESDDSALVSVETNRFRVPAAVTPEPNVARNAADSQRFAIRTESD